MAVPRPSEDAPTPRITAYTWSPSRSASSIRLSANMTTPSPSIVPSAAAENGLQSPVGDSAGVLVKHRYMEMRSEEHTSELQSHSDLVCRLLLEKKKTSTAQMCCIIERHVSCR